MFFITKIQRAAFLHRYRTFCLMKKSTNIARIAINGLDYAIFTKGGTHGTGFMYGVPTVQVK